MNNSMIATFRNALEVYDHLCRPVCKSANILQGELHILLFLGDNPEKNTAMDVHKCGGMKQSMISTLVEKLVQGGYLERQSVPGDRRKVQLILTEKAQPVIKEGRAVKKKMAKYISEGISEEDSKAFDRVMTIMGQNILSCREKMLKGEL